MRPRTLSLDALRALATAMIVGLHAGAYRWLDLAPSSRAWLGLTVIDGATRWALPVFFMITGALFLGRPQRTGIRSVWTRSLPRLVVAFVVWSVVYAFLRQAWSGAPFSWRRLFDVRPLTFYHLWFLPAIIALYLVLPLLWAVCRERVLARYLVVLSLAFFTATTLAPYDPTRTAAPLVAMLTPAMVTGYVGYAVAGHLLATTTRTVGTGVLLAAAGLGIAVTIAMTAATSLAAGKPDDHWLGYLTPHVALTCAAVFLLLRRAEPALQRAGARWRGAIAWLSENSFGVYLVHPALLVAVMHLTRGWSVPAPLVALLAWAVVLPLAYVVSFLLRQVPGVGRYVA